MPLIDDGPIQLFAAGMALWTTHEETLRGFCGLRELLPNEK